MQFNFREKGHLLKQIGVQQTSAGSPLKMWISSVKIINKLLYQWHLLFIFSTIKYFLSNNFFNCSKTKMELYKNNLMVCTIQPFNVNIIFNTPLRISLVYLTHNKKKITLWRSVRHKGSFNLYSIDLLKPLGILSGN